MDDWFEELNRAVDTMRQDLETLFQEATDAAIEFTDSMIQISEEVGEQVQTTLLTEAEQVVGILVEQVDEWLTPGYFSLDIDLYWDPNLSEPWVERITHSDSQHSGLRRLQALPQTRLQRQFAGVRHASLRLGERGMPRLGTQGAGLKQDVHNLA